MPASLQVGGVRTSNQLAFPGCELGSLTSESPGGLVYKADSLALTCVCGAQKSAFSAASPGIPYTQTITLESCCGSPR